jgi:hypothetical protein
MARRSAAAESTRVIGAIGHRLPPPRGLSKAERDLWTAITDSKPADWFGADSAPVLREYVRAAVVCDRLADLVEQAFKGEGDEIKAALDLRDKESRRLMSLGTKLRLTIQSRHSPRTAETANRRAAGRRPWQQ